MIPIAACGVNCFTCYAYQREKNRCLGCHSDSTQKLHHCSVCKIANCELLKATRDKFCYECQKFPCVRLKQLDKRYREKYHNTSLIGNILRIKEVGLEAFLKEEEIKWKCPNCGRMLCIHREECLMCGQITSLKPTSQNS